MAKGPKIFAITVFNDEPESVARELRQEPEVLQANLMDASVQASDGDRKWFKAHPDRTMRLRPALPAERRVSAWPVDKHLVLVIQIKGARLRIPIEITSSLTVADWCADADEAKCAKVADDPNIAATILKNFGEGKMREFLKRLGELQ